MSVEQDFRPVRSADRTLDLLELLAANKEGVSFNQIAEFLDLPKSSLSGLLRTLTARKYIQRTSDGKRFQLGIKVLELSSGYINDGGLFDSARQSIRHLADEFGETAHLAVLDGADLIFIAVEQTRHSMRMTLPLGRRLPAYASAAGKCLLMYLSEEKLDQLYSPQLDRVMPRTVTSLADLKRELSQSRRLRYAYDTEEFVLGLHSVSAPIFDASGRAVASIGLSIPVARLEEVGIGRVALAVRAAAQELSRSADYASEEWKMGRVKVAWSMGAMHVQSYHIMQRTAERLSAKYNADIIWTDAREDNNKQAADVSSLLALKPDVIIIHPAHAVLADQLFIQTARAGIPAIAFQRPVRSRNFDYFVGGNTYSEGRLIAGLVASLLNYQGNIAMIQGDPYNDNSRNIAQGVYDELRSHPGLKIVADQPSPFWSRETAHELAESILRENKDNIDAFIVANDDMAGGVAEVLEEFNLTKKILLVGGDGDLDALQRIKEGVQHGTAFQDWMELARETLSFAVDVANGKVDRNQLHKESIHYSPPGIPVFVKYLPYTLIERSTINKLEQFWSEALAQALPELLPEAAGVF